MNNASKQAGFHGIADYKIAGPLYPDGKNTKFTYSFSNFFHPYVGELIQALNQRSLRGMLDPATQSLKESFFFDIAYTALDDAGVKVAKRAKEIDFSEGGAYANYNWELFFHVPLTIAVHLSKAQRFAEAQHWFHYIFDPTSNDLRIAPPQRYWKFLGFHRKDGVYDIAQLLSLLSTPDNELTEPQKQLKAQALDGYNAIKKYPFRPHKVARTRPLAYQYQVVMKYLDNLIAWGDSLFLQDTVESINEATQRYVLAANLLGPRPQKVSTGRVEVRTFAQLKELKVGGLDATGNALVELEAQFPFNFAAPHSSTGDADSEWNGAVFGIGRTLYFSVPDNARMLAYWDTVADRLYKIRNCMNIGGSVRQLPLFEPPLDPGMLVKAAAAGIDIGSIVAGTNQPVGPLRAMPLIQKALELTSEVRSLGGSLLAALEKGDAEHLALLRQGQETKVHKLAQDVRFLQWKNAEQGTEALLRARASAWERYRYYLRMHGLEPNPDAAPETPAMMRTAFTDEKGELTEAKFAAVYAALVTAYDTAIVSLPYTELNLVEASAPSFQAGATCLGGLYLTPTENAEVNQHLPAVRDALEEASTFDVIASVLTFVPELSVMLQPLGVGADSKVFGGSKLADAAKIASEILKTQAIHDSYQAGIAGRTAALERRADDWVLQANLAARELAHFGRQIIGSLLAEQIARHEYLNVTAQIAHSEEVDTFLHSKFTDEDLHLWMQGEVSRLYYQWYRLAFDTARRAERTMKLELRRPELDATDFVQFNYWDSGRKGLLSGEALHLDVKRMEMAYHDNNRRELELTRHISLRQLDPLALLQLKATGTATFTIPERLYDLDNPGHYMRRIKSVAVSVPSVTGPYTPVPCTLSLQRSSMRVKPSLREGTIYKRTAGAEDDRFIDAFGPVESIVTSTGLNDSGLFEAPQRDERFLPFEGAGAESTWRVELPRRLRSFDYSTITDVILHVRYTARQGGQQLGDKALEDIEAVLKVANSSGLALLFSLRHDFPTAWSAFAQSEDPGNLQIKLSKSLFPYMVQDKEIDIADEFELYAGTTKLVRRTIETPSGFSALLNKSPNEASLSLSADPTVLTKEAHDAFLVVKYGLTDSTGTPSDQ
ncbi:hypothetical protein [Streptomyces labedae]|uniref:Tc toxin complex TcA C-terminal TcB-binding domain-containing protein n=1 Tax=Streptomyces labedae TaxID=285569 RepID=A0ABP6R019_9ACTN